MQDQQDHVTHGSDAMTVRSPCSRRRAPSRSLPAHGGGATTTTRRCYRPIPPSPQAAPPRGNPPLPGPGSGAWSSKLPLCRAPRQRGRACPPSCPSSFLGAGLAANHLHGPPDRRSSPTVVPAAADAHLLLVAGDFIAVSSLAGAASDRHLWMLAAGLAGLPGAAVDLSPRWRAGRVNPVGGRRCSRRC